MKMIYKIAAVIVLFLFIGCVQQPVQPVEPTTPEEPVVEQPEQVCTEMWLCQDEKTKAYRKSDCTFEQITDCPAGCENGECNEVVKEPEEPIVEEPETQTCTPGYTCLDDKRYGRQSSNCEFSNVEECPYGCKDGKCITEAPPQEEIKEEYTLTQGKGTMVMPGNKLFDFSREQTFLTEVDNFDLKIKLYSASSNYDYFRLESSGPDLWIISKGITEAIRSDCMQKKDENSYQYLKTGQTVCIQTKEKDIALLGGYWEGLPDEYTELTWKYYVPKK